MGRRGRGPNRSWKYESYHIFVKVDDCWYPNLPKDTIKISVMTLLDGKAVRICAWGGDDFGMEMDLKVASDQDRSRKYKRLVKYANNLKELEPINVEYLESEGWIRA